MLADGSVENSQPGLPEQKQFAAGECTVCQILGAAKTAPTLAEPAHAIGDLVVALELIYPSPRSWGLDDVSRPRGPPSHS